MALVELRVRGFAVLDSVCIAPGRGLTVLTGETGAGKSLCIAALRLALGGKVEGSPVRPDAPGASVVAVFDDVPGSLCDHLAAIGVDPDDLLTVSREIPADGRATCRINGALVSQATLRQVGEALVEITGQGESHRLVQPARQRQILDAFGGPPVAAAGEALADAFSRWRAALDALEASRAACLRSAAEVEWARHVVAELAPLHLDPAEGDALKSERERLRHATELAGAATALWRACGGDDDSPGGADVVAGAMAQAQTLRGVDAALDALAIEAAETVCRLRELAGRARGLRDALDADPARLAAVEERLDAFDRARRRHGGTIESAIAALAGAEETVAAADGDGGAEASLVADVARLQTEVSACAARLSTRRIAAAAALERTTTAQLRRLRLPQARLRILVSRLADGHGIDIDGEQVACTADGIDAVDFRFTASRDGVPLPLSGGISGGELSRLALALRAVVALADDAPSVVLDEVDTGIGGETAARVGEVLASIGQERQILVVTHRAEIAARAGCHLVVVRDPTAPASSATVAAVDGEERALEIARLMSGRATRVALLRAAELLEEGRGTTAGAAARTIAPR
jgi:DNA repair protein RecN (Recombination protein N)